MRKSTFYVGSY